MSKFISIRFKELLRRLHNAEHFDFFGNYIINGLQTLITSLTMVSGIFDALKTVFEREDALYKLSQASVLTADITALHEKRIALFSFFWHYVAIFKYLGDMGKSLAAEKLLFLRNNYKDLPYVAYPDASGMMTNFLQDCENSVWKPYIQLLGLTFLVTAMEESNEEFGTKYRDRFIDKEMIADLGKLAGTRVEVDSAFDALVDAINVAWKANELGAKDSGIRTKLIQARDVVVGAIHQAELNMAHRGPHKKDDDKVDGGTQTPGVTPPPAPPTPPQAPDTTNPPAPDTPPQAPDTTNPPAPDLPPQAPDTGIPPINPDDLNPPAAGE
ncbi:MAG: alanine and proline-rich secreted protein Apa [Tannerellaceae bacterium]|jgi:hypothetical protein|nr:alanine and proline-rich secreted protein Apa [Tannerellaceae bacterium]